MTTPAIDPPGTKASENRERDGRWQAVLGRDPDYHEAFVYAVRSTGIYCRPTCPSRKPGRRQVLFFPGPGAAQQAGFRPCRRCLPQQPPSSDQHIELVRRVCRRIQESYYDESCGSRPTLARLGGELGVSPYHLQRVFKRVMGVTPHQYADACRLDQLKTGIKNHHSLTDALYGAGYGSSSRLYQQASTRLGMTPGGYQRGGRDLPIAYTVADSPLGPLLVAATRRGVCSVSLGDSEAELTSLMHLEFPAARVRRDDATLGRWVEAIVEHLAGRLPRIEVPLDLRATAFQRLVWEELRRSPYGETRTYGDIARAIHQPRAARAVAQACRRNPVAVVIPCHRVVRRDGATGGYRWGTGCKEALLEREKGLADGGNPG
jgi:AraC family transcriptional regulator of adaptative response/methylated-DNA-[protein]-cysteine methyltransferase